MTVERKGLICAVVIGAVAGVAVANMNKAAESFKTESGEDSTTYSPNPLGSAGVEFEKVSAFDEWDTPCCRVCPPGAEGWCEAIGNADFKMYQGQHITPYQDKPLLPDPFTLKATSPNQNQTYTDGNGRYMTVSEWRNTHDVSISSDYGAMAVSRNGNDTLHLRRV